MTRWRFAVLLHRKTPPPAETCLRWAAFSGTAQLRKRTMAFKIHNEQASGQLRPAAGIALAELIRHAVILTTAAVHVLTSFHFDE